MLKQRARALSAGLLAVELGLWTVGLAAAHALVHAVAVAPVQPLPVYAPELLAAIAAWSIWSRTTDLVRSQRTRPQWRELQGVVGGVVAVAVAAGLVSWALRPIEDSRLLVVAWSLIAFASIVGLRTSVRVALRRARIRGFNYRTLAIVGDGALAERLAQTVLDHREWGLQLAGFIRTREDVARTPTGPVLGQLEHIATILDGTVIDEVLFACEGQGLDRFEKAFTACEEAGVNSRIVLDFFPHRFSRMELDDLDGFPMLAFHATSNAELALLAKRAFDVTVAGFALVVGAPIFLAAALAVKLSSPGPVLFAQRRVGLHGREFTLYKFRSMVADAEARQPALDAHNEMRGPVFKMREDPRVTSVGRWLRRTSLDEIPQFLNVLRGDMSLVGPRPPLPSEVARYERWQRRRLSVKPGLTCTWQVSGRSDVDFDTWMKLDLSYIDNWSLWLDAKIVLQTIPAVLLARGAR